jgi:hypothetical protein
MGGAGFGAVTAANFMKVNANASSRGYRRAIMDPLRRRHGD